MTGTRETPAQLDSAIDRLLRERAEGPRAHEGELAATARVLRDSLPRFHPRFSFEEHVAGRLSARARPGTAEEVEPTPIRPDIGVAALESAPTEAALAAADRRRRGLVAGGAIASGVSIALPLAGAAIVRWRRSRSSGGLL